MAGHAQQTVLGADQQVAAIFGQRVDGRESRWACSPGGAVENVQTVTRGNP
jgi:hypothetical protein